MGFRPPHRREKTADRLEDLAAALDAGLSPLEALDTDAGSFVDAIAHEGLALDAVDRRVLEAAERAGEIPAALRERANAARQIAALQRGIAGRLAYPAFLIVCAIALSLFMSSLGLGVGATVPIGAASLLAGAIAAIAWSVRRAHGTADLPLLLRPVQRLALDYGSIPYLAALRGLYRSGVPILEAHDLASRAAPIGAVRARLLHAGQLLERNRRALSEALAASAAVDSETLRILDAAERSGDLEGGLARALARRGDAVSRRLHGLARVLGGVCYVIAVAIVMYVVLGFYGRLYGGL